MACWSVSKRAERDGHAGSAWHARACRAQGKTKLEQRAVGLAQVWSGTEAAAEAGATYGCGRLPSLGALGEAVQGWTAPEDCVWRQSICAQRAACQHYVAGRPSFR
eukprot:jgi/Ulvmu1/25/UM001_0026.1